MSRSRAKWRFSFGQVKGHTLIIARTRLSPAPLGRKMLLSNKTPQCKGGATKVIVQGTTSPGLKTPSAVVFINNDEEERRQRRLESRMRGMMSPGLSVRPQNR